ncbi:hypothetical protein Prudu_007243 [Prunus dulcis]|uniref:Uncharacterized protein n=1 Tax=Prunus dulcis TaxID=3755 RepID=A0A4Y1R1N6_PRUDU|nr:hypothetical protein Prudu_007243 [Prunus dulcis]
MVLTMAGANHAIGIDLGTTYSCVAVWQHDHVEVIVNDQGNRTTPSYVAFTDTDRFIGDAAFNQVLKNPVNCWNFKRVKLRRYNDNDNLDIFQRLGVHKRECTQSFKDYCRLIFEYQYLRGLKRAKMENKDMTYIIYAL